MFGDIGWAELLLIGVVALIVIGPEDLPDMFRQIGRFTAKLRQMSREFSRAMEQAAKDSGVRDVAEDLKDVASPKSLGLSKVKEAADRFEKWDPIKNAAKPTVVAKPLVPPPMPATPDMAPALAETGNSIINHGPETRALIEKQAAKKAILDETAAKLRAVGSEAAAETAPVATTASKPAKPAVKSRAKATPPLAEASPGPKLRARATRKKGNEA